MNFGAERIMQKVSSKRKEFLTDDSGFDSFQGRFFHLALLKKGRKDLMEIESWKDEKVLGPRAKAKVSPEGKKVLAREFREAEISVAANCFYSMKYLKMEKFMSGCEEPLGIIYPKEGGAVVLSEFIQGEDLKVSFEKKLLGGNGKEVCAGACSNLASMHARNAMHNHPHVRNIVFDGERAHLVDMKHVRPLDFYRKNFRYFFSDVSHFLVTAMGKWREECSAKILEDVNEARECMEKYLEYFGLLDEIDFAMHAFHNSLCEMSYNAKLFSRQ